jgi:uncharacterized membrane protein
MNEQNPYAPPAVSLRREEAPAGPAGFLVGGRQVGSGHGYLWLTDAFEIFKKSPWTWIAMSVVYVVMEGLVAQIPYAGRYILYMFSPLFAAGFVIGCQAVTEGRRLELGALFAGFSRNTSRLFTLGGIHLGLMALVVGVNNALAGGSFAALIAAAKDGRLETLALGGALLASTVDMLILIPVSMAFFYAPALVTLNDLSPGDAIKASFSAAAKNVLPYIVYVLFTVLFSFLAALPCGLGLLVLMPTATASLYTSYRDVFYETQPGWPAAAPRDPA